MFEFVAVAGAAAPAGYPASYDNYGDWVGNTLPAYAASRAVYTPPSVAFASNSEEGPYRTSFIVRATSPSPGATYKWMLGQYQATGTELRIPVPMAMHDTTYSYEGYLMGVDVATGSKNITPVQLSFTARGSCSPRRGIACYGAGK